MKAIVHGALHQGPIMPHRGKDPLRNASEIEDSVFSGRTHGDQAACFMGGGELVGHKQDRPPARWPIETMHAHAAIVEGHDA